MSKTLSIILTVFKVTKIVAKVLFIVCIVGAALCALGFTVCSTFSLIATVFDTDFFDDADFASACLECIIGAVSCVGIALFSHFAQKYATNVLNAGTPFTFEGSKECFRLGIITAIISVATSSLSGIIPGAIVLFDGLNNFDVDLGSPIAVSTGALLVFLSLVFKYGAEQQQTSTEDKGIESEEEPSQESKNANE